MKKIFTLIFIFFSLFLISCDEKKTTVEITLYNEDNTIYQIIELDEGSSISNLNSYTLTKEGYAFLGWTLNDNLITSEDTFDEDESLYPKFEKEEFVDFDLSAVNLSGTEGSQIKIKLTFKSGSLTPDITWSTSDKEVGKLFNPNKTTCPVVLLKEGTVTISASAKDYNVEKSITLTVMPEVFKISYDLTGYENATFVGDQVESFTIHSFPITLPKLSLDDFYFLGWRVNGSEKTYFSLTETDISLEELKLTPVWNYPEISIDNENYNLLKPSDKYLLSLSNNIGVSSTLDDYNIQIENEGIVILENGYIVAENVGSTVIKINLKSLPNIVQEFGITVVDSSLYENLAFQNIISTLNLNPFYQNIKVYGWQKTYDYGLQESVSTYLFEDLKIIENIAPETNENRPGTKATKYYICVHDTGDAEYTAKDWSTTVYNNFNEQSGKVYNCSFQYVVGNDGIYHNIPDDEVSWHAGDGTKVPYSLTSTGVYGTNKYPKVSIDTEGYYTLDGVRTSVLAPTYNGKILTEADINDNGVRVILSDTGEYLMGLTHYDSTYRKIANYGGNVNSIGIESCINYGSDIFLTWQRLAKLVANLMNQNNLTIDDVEPHHYFSGKNCPGTMRGAGRWDYFKSLILQEYQMIKLQEQKITYSLKSNSEYVNNNGRIISQPKDTTLVSYDITINNNGKMSTFTMYSSIRGSKLNLIEN